ncbi:Hypothetical_protein [Hexamita inflata]|uniref:Hypothetical_protein n=1 Tax=Hexamita inflata TaxID=28002 RepID=A0AA86N7J8_9EUKA|nr:Hypothetical protein HINF_LOCUS1534 [Hexamita inflata]
MFVLSPQAVHVLFADEQKLIPLQTQVYVRLFETEFAGHLKHVSEKLNESTPQVHAPPESKAPEVVHQHTPATISWPVTEHLQTPLFRTVLAGWHTHAAPTKTEFAGQLQSPATRGRPDVHLQVYETESNAESASQWQTPFVSQAPRGHGQVRPTANALGARGPFEIPEKEIPLWETDPAPVTLKTNAQAFAAPFMTREKRIASMETAAWASQTRPYTSFPERAPERLTFLIERASVWTSTSAQPFKEVAWKANEEFSMWQVASWCARPKKVLVWAPTTSNLVWFRTSLVVILKVRPQNAESASY